jgi:hypothetical protein
MMKSSLVRTMRTSSQATRLQVALVIAAVLLVGDSLLVAEGKRRFQRARLVVEAA